MKLIKAIVIWVFAVLSTVVLFMGGGMQLIIDLIRWDGKYNRAYRYFMSSALAIDVMGNTLFKPLLNAVFTKKNSYSYGTDITETISSVTGKNQCIDGLTWFGRGLASILNILDKDHCYKSINDPIYHTFFSIPKKEHWFIPLSSLFVFLAILFSLWKLLVYVVY